MPICPRCDANNPDGANYCLSCGTALTGAHSARNTAPLTPMSQTAAQPQVSQTWVAPPPSAGTTPYTAAPVQYQQAAPPPAPAPQPISIVVQQTASPQYYAAQPARGHKSVFLAFVLTLFFGPFGMFYSTVKGAVIMLIVTVVLGAATSGVGLFFTQIVCIIWGMIAADSYNKGNG